MLFNVKISIVFVLIFISTILFSQNECQVTYISNEGFIIETNGKKVIFDALFDKIDGNWVHSPSDSIVELMENSKAPFDQVDLITISHKHIDHFNEHVVVNHLLSNPKGVVICPKQVGDILSKNPEYAKIKDRIVSVTPSFLSDTNLMISNIPIRILRLEHSHFMEEDSVSGTMFNRHNDIENLGYLLNIDGTKIFHCGDTNPLNEEEYPKFSLQNEAIDIAFLERMFFSHEKTELISQYIQPKHIILMHINPANLSLYVEYFKDQEGIKFFENKMESVILHLND